MKMLRDYTVIRNLHRYSENFINDILTTAINCQRNFQNFLVTPVENNYTINRGFKTITVFDAIITTYNNNLMDLLHICQIMNTIDITRIKVPYQSVLP